MSLSYPLALHFPPAPLSELSNGVDAILEIIKVQHSAPSNFRDLASELIFEKFSGSWLNTVEFDRNYPSVGTAIRQGKWLRLSFDLHIVGGVYGAELYVFPLPDDPGKGAFQLNFEGRLYAALYEFKPRASGGFNADVKRDFSMLCYQVATSGEAQSFILLPDNGSLVSIATNEVADRLRHPQIEMYGRRAGLITGIKSNLVSTEELYRTWGLALNDPRLIMTTSGYVVLDLLQQYTES